MLQRPLIAIDIGTSAIKLVSVSGKEAKKLHTMGLELLPEGAVVGGLIKDTNVVAEILKALIKKLRIFTPGARAALSLGAGAVLMKKLVFPAETSPSEIAEQIFFEAEQHFGYSADELLIDHHLMAKDDKSGEQPVLLVGARRDAVEIYLNVIHQTKMRVGVIESHVISTTNMLSYNFGATDELVSLINIGSATTQVSTIRQGELLFSRDIAIGGDEYTKQLAHTMSLSPANAESLKVAASLGDKDTPIEMQKIIGDTNEQLVNEIVTSIEFYMQGPDRLDDTPLSKLYLCGGGAKTLGLDAALAAHLKIPVQITNPFHRVEINEKRFQLDYILAQGHLYGVALGLALRSMSDQG